LGLRCFFWLDPPTPAGFGDTDLFGTFPRNDRPVSVPPTISLPLFFFSLVEFFSVSRFFQRFIRPRGFLTGPQKAHPAPPLYFQYNPAVRSVQVCESPIFFCQSGFFGPLKLLGESRKIMQKKLFSFLFSVSLAPLLDFSPLGICVQSHGHSLLRFYTGLRPNRVSDFYFLGSPELSSLFLLKFPPPPVCCFDREDLF